MAARKALLNYVIQTWTTLAVEREETAQISLRRYTDLNLTCQLPDLHDKDVLNSLEYKQRQLCQGVVLKHFGDHDFVKKPLQDYSHCRSVLSRFVRPAAIFFISALAFSFLA